MDKNVVARLLESRKFVVCLLGVAVAGVLTALHVITGQQFEDLLKWTVGGFTIGTGLEGIGGPTVAAPTSRTSDP